jgi:hypothetical protein
MGNLMDKLNRVTLCYSRKHIDSALHLQKNYPYSPEKTNCQGKKTSEHNSIADVVDKMFRP